MIVSEARLAANRRNALRSTGPKTPEGKERSRANALKHGLCASVVVAEDAALVQQRATEFFKTLRPQNHFHCWLVSEIALLSIRIDRAERTERRSRDKVSIRAELCWDDDRRLEAVALGATLGDRPEEVVGRMGRTPQGCEWMMARWAMLAHSADVKKVWTPEQTRLAFDLLGTPEEFRDGHKPGTALDFRGRVVGSAEEPAVVARREIAAWEDRRAVARALDEADRALAAADLTDDNDAELRRLRRYESTLHSRLRWCMAQLRYQSPQAEPLRGLLTSWLGQHEPPPDAQPEPAPGPEAEVGGPAGESWLPEIHPPFDLEPDECPAPGEPVNIPAILASRRDKKARKAESRRQARRRKVETLRA